MTINSSITDGALTVSVAGRLDSATGDEFAQYVDEHFTDDVSKLIFDFADVDFISSKGLRILVSAYKKLNGRSMEILNANSSVTEILRISGFLKIFNVK